VWELAVAGPRPVPALAVLPGRLQDQCRRGVRVVGVEERLGVDRPVGSALGVAGAGLAGAGLGGQPGRQGLVVSARASRPATTGAAKEVPLSKATPGRLSWGQPRSWLKPATTATATHSPGATTSTLPKEEKSATRPWASVAPTESTPGNAAGYWGTRSPVLPAAATTALPASSSR
jgi:hypothetical protein